MKSALLVLKLTSSPTNQMNFIIMTRKLKRNVNKIKPLYIMLIWSILILCIYILLKLQNWKPNQGDLKYVLLWSPRLSDRYKDSYLGLPIPICILGLGQTRLYQLNCPIKNCFFTDNRNYFGGDLKNFDVVVFNGMSKEDQFESDLPKQRYVHQKYVFMNNESADRYPACSSSYDNFFNWTYTYKINSDCVMSYFNIKDKEGNIVGPNMNMNWVEPMTKKIGKVLEETIKKRNKTAAWFVSNCDDQRSHRNEKVKEIQTELDKYNLQIDIYGKCGNLNCTNCDTMLENEYFFYLAFENSMGEDYVTEKVYRAMNYKVVPIVFGGANYSRFLPPGSYLDAKILSPKDLAYNMHQMVNNRSLYSSFLRWTNHYQYSDGIQKSICDFCELINNKNKLREFSFYEDFRSWWHPDFKKRCEDIIEDPKFLFFLTKPLEFYWDSKGYID